MKKSPLILTALALAICVGLIGPVPLAQASTGTEAEILNTPEAYAAPQPIIPSFNQDATGEDTGSSAPPTDEIIHDDPPED